MKPQAQFTSIGGQAVIEGVMMRSPHFIAVAVRKPDHKIVIRTNPYEGVASRYPILKKPLIRGVVTLVESMVQGMSALSFSANIAATEGLHTEAAISTSGGAAVGAVSSPDSSGGKEELSSWAIAGSMGLAFVLGMALFVAFPHLVTVYLTRNSFSVESPFFHLIDGVIKMSVLLTYVYLISLMKDIKRVFQYHGAEHKSIYAFEAGLDLTVENARKFTTLHPRCGTSFLLFLVLISIAVFSIVFPLLGLTQLSSIPVVNHLLMIVAKIFLMFPVAGISYEFIKACACRMENPIFRAMIWPGMVLQNLTTREPDDGQLEVALASLRQVLRMEKGAKAPKADEFDEIEVADLNELVPVAAGVSEFLE